MPTTNRLAIVTGASSGFGLALCHSLVKKDWLVYGISRSQPAINQPNFKYISCDLSQPTSVEKLIATLFEEVSQLPKTSIAALVNSAGTIEPVDLVQNLDDTSAIVGSLTLNLASAIRLMSFVGKAFAGCDTRIVNISSGAASKPYEGWAVYCSSKYGLKAASEVFHKENKDSCSVYLLDPGPMATPMQDRLREIDEDSFPNKQRFVKMHEQGELTPVEEIVQEAEGFLSQEMPPAWKSERYSGQHSTN